MSDQKRPAITFEFAHAWTIVAALVFSSFFLGGMSYNLYSINQTIERINVRLDSMDNRLGRVETRLEHIEKRLDRLETR